MPASLSGRFGLTSVPAEGVKRLSAPSQATDSLDDQAPTNDLGEPPCPFNVAKFEDHKQCGTKSLPKEACADESNSTTFKQKRDVQRQCKRMCNPDCDPTRAISRLPMNVNYFPLAKIVRGHQFCKARYTVSTQPDATLNRATGQVVQMPVCAKCISNNYYLQPAYASGGQVFGNCAPLTKNILWVEANKACSSASKEPASSPVGINSGQEQVAVRLADSDEDSTTGRRRKKTDTAAPPPERRRKKTETAAAAAPRVCTPGKDAFNTCIQFGAGWGTHEGFTKGERKVTKGVHTAGGSAMDGDVMPPGNMAVSFTCARTYVTNPRDDKCMHTGKFFIRRIYNIVQTTVSSCHSAEEDHSGSTAPRLSCVNKKVLKSCHVKVLKRQSEFYKKNSKGRKRKNKCNIEPESPVWVAAIKDLEEKASDQNGWEVCSPLEASVRTSVN